MGPSRKRMFADARISRGALILLVITSCLSLVYLVGPRLQAAMASWLVATPYAVGREFKLWTLVTSPLLETDFISLIFQALMLWMFLPTLERLWGMKRFLRFALYTSVAGIVGGTAVGLALGGSYLAAPIGGLECFTYAAMLAFGVVYASQPIRFFGAIPMTGKQLAIGISLFALAFIVIGQTWVQGAAQATAMALAYVLVSTRGSPRLLWLKWKQARMRRRFGVVEGGKSRPRDTRWLN